MTREEMIDEAVRRTTDPGMRVALEYHASLRCGENCNQPIDFWLQKIRNEFHRLYWGTALITGRL